MFDWIVRLIKAYPAHCLAPAAIINFIVFVGHLASALSDGVISPEELHQLTASSSCIELLILGVVMLSLRNKQK